VRGRCNQHEWDYMGVDTEDGREYGYRRSCKKHRYNTEKGFTFISKKEYDNRVKEGKVVFK